MHAGARSCTIRTCTDRVMHAVASRADLTSKYGRIRIRIRAGAMVQTRTPVQLKPQTLKSFSAYIRDVDAAIKQTLGDGSSFLWSDVNTERAAVAQSLFYGCVDVTNI